MNEVSRILYSQQAKIKELKDVIRHQQSVLMDRHFKIKQLEEEVAMLKARVGDSK